MTQTYEYTTRVGGLCCYFGQEDKVIPQPGDNLLILDLCQCPMKVTGKLKADEGAVCGQALFFDPADGCLTGTPTVDCFYGIAKETVMATPGEKCPVTVYTQGGFDVDQVTVDGTLGDVSFALQKEARGLGIYFEKRYGASVQDGEK